VEIRDYIKIEEMKALLTGQLINLGLKDKTTGVIDDDLNKLIVLMSALSGHLKKRETEGDKVQFLVNYIIGLWGILLIDYNHDVSEL